METSNRIKQTARKSTGGKPPSSKRGFFSSPGGDSAAQQHSDTQRDPVQKRRPEDITTYQDGRAQSPSRSRKPMSRDSTTKTDSPREKGKEDPGQAKFSAPNSRNDIMWTAPTSNVRGGDEEEEDELLSSPSSTSQSPWTTEKSSATKTNSDVNVKCDRCRLMGSKPACLPQPGSKKCAKCFRDHRNCSWTGGLTSPSSSLRGQSSPKTGKAKSMNHEKERKTSAPAHGSTAANNKINHRHGQAQQNGPKCTRCASFAHSPICERSDDPNDLKCKKCRRDKQSCSFAPFGKPFTKRKKTVSAGNKGQTDDETDEGEEKEEQDGSTSTTKKGAEDGTEKRTGPDSEERQTVGGGARNRSESPIASPKKVKILHMAGNVSSLKSKRSMLLAIAGDQRNTSKRKKDGDRDDSPNEGDRNPTKKKKPSTTVSNHIVSPSSSNVNGTLDVANSSPHHNPHSGLPHINGTRGTSTPSSVTTPRIISIPQGHTHAGRHSVMTRPMDQPPETVELVQDRSITVIERELRAAEVKAASHRAIAESYLKDADRAEEEVTKLKEELLTAVRTNLGFEGAAAERKMLIEKLVGSVSGENRHA